MIELKNRKNICLLVLVECIIIIMFLIFLYKKDLISLVLNQNDFEIYDEFIGEVGKDSFIVDYQHGEEWEEAHDYLHTIAMPLPAGSYDITIDYCTNQGGNLYKITSSEMQNILPKYYNDIFGFLPQNSQRISCDITLLKDVEDFHIIFSYIGCGELQINNISIKENNRNVFQRTVKLASILLLLNIIIYIVLINFSKIINQKEYVFGVLFLVITVSIPLLVEKGLIFGQDIEFHQMRIWGIKECILNGDIPSRIHPQYMRGYGYATGVMYPQLFLYIPAVICALGFSMTTAYKLFIFSIEILTIICSLYSFNKIFKNKYVALWGTILYVLFPYRLLDMHMRSAVGEICAMIGLPLIALGLYQLIHEDKKESLSIFPLVCGYSIVFQSHILSCIFVALFSILIGVIFIRKLITQGKILFLLKVFSIFTLLNAFALIPWLDYYRIGFNEFVKPISGINILSLIQNIEVSDGLYLAVGISSLISVLSFILFVWREREYREIGIIACLSGGFSIFLISSFCPWKELYKIPFLKKIVSNIQFTWRFTEILAICVSIVGAVGLFYLSKLFNKKVILYVLMLCSLVGYICNYQLYTYDRTKKEFSFKRDYSFNVGLVGEYLKEGTDYESFLKKGCSIETSSNQIVCSNYNKKGSKTEVNVSSMLDVDGFIEMPIVYYPGYVAIDSETNTKLGVDYGNNNLLKITIPAKYNGMVKIDYMQLWYWKLGNIISLFTLFILIRYEYVRRREVR